MLEYESIEQWAKDGTMHWVNVAQQSLELLQKNNIIDLNLIDIGSNVGGYALMLSQAHKINNLLLVEPIPELLEYSKNIFKDNAFYENIALSDKEFISKMYIPTEHNLGVGRLNACGQIEVKVNTFDVMIQKYSFEADLIKIDAEGCDIDILYGMNDYLSRVNRKPIIIIEVDTNAITATEYIRLVDYVSKHKYILVDYAKERASKDLFLIPEGFNY